MISQHSRNTIGTEWTHRRRRSFWLTGDEVPCWILASRHAAAVGDAGVESFPNAGLGLFATFLFFTK